MAETKVKMISRKKDVKLVAARTGGRRLEVVSPRLGYPVRTMLTFYREIPAGGMLSLLGGHTLTATNPYSFRFLTAAGGTRT